MRPCSARTRRSRITPTILLRAGAFGLRPLYCLLGLAFVTPLLALPRSCHPTSSVALRFVPPLRCAGASEVRPCPSPVGRAQLFPKRSNNFLVLGSSASLIGSELSTLVGSGLYTGLGRAFVNTFLGAWKAFSPKFAPNLGSWHRCSARKYRVLENVRYRIWGSFEVSCDPFCCDTQPRFR